jgi:hypothetical protein
MQEEQIQKLYVDQDPDESQAKKPFIITHPPCNTPKFLRTTARLRLSK